MPHRTISPTQLAHFSNLRRENHAAPVTLDASFLDALAATPRAVRERFLGHWHGKPGEVLFLEGDAGDALYVLKSGLIAVFKGAFDAPVMLAYRGAGEIIGEMSLLEDRPRSATAVVLETAHLLSIGRNDFYRWLVESPSAGVNLLKTLSLRLRESDSARRSEKQAARELLGQLNELKSEKEQLLELQHLRQEMADLILHDLRNPLATIQGALALLRVSLPSEALAAHEEILEIATLSTERLKQLVNTLLEVARLEAGAMSLNQQAVDVRQHLEHIASHLAILAHSSGVALRVSTPAELPLAHADPEVLERVVTNLVDNALKYSPRQSEVTLEAAAAGEMLAVSVTDQGSGIPAEQRERIFEHFAQVQGEHLKRRGFGLGLVFCRLAAEAHGGRIWVEDNPAGPGSRFVFTVPRAFQ